MSYVGFYINLERSIERREAVEQQLARHDLTGSYTRFRAAEGNTLNFPSPGISDGEIGCFTSHYLVLKENLDKDQHLHVVEDDVLFSTCTKGMIDFVIGSGVLDTYDIVFTDIMMPLDSMELRFYKNLYSRCVKRGVSGKLKEVMCRLVNLKNKRFSCMTSYLVSSKSVRKLHDLYAKRLEANPNLPVDSYIDLLVQKNVIKAGCIFPFVTSVNMQTACDSTIRGNGSWSIPWDLARHAFFVDSDWSVCSEYAQRLPVPEDNNQHELLARLLSFSMTDKFVERSGWPKQPDCWKVEF